MAKTAKQSAISPTRQKRLKKLFAFTQEVGRLPENSEILKVTGLTSRGSIASYKKNVEAVLPRLLAGEKPSDLLVPDIQIGLPSPKTPFAEPQMASETSQPESGVSYPEDLSKPSQAILKPTEAIYPKTAILKLENGFEETLRLVFRAGNLPIYEKAKPTANTLQIPFRGKEVTVDIDRLNRRNDSEPYGSDFSNLTVGDVKVLVRAHG